MIQPKESRRHHFVPEFLLSPRATDGELSGYWWDGHQRRLSCRRERPKAFCYESDLLTVERHEEGRDVLERKFFGAIDTRGALARDRLLAEGPDSLDVDQARGRVNPFDDDPCHVQRAGVDVGLSDAALSEVCGRSSHGRASVTSLRRLDRPPRPSQRPP